MINNNAHVLMIYTGGTIGMIENPETSALESFDFEHLRKHFPEMERFKFRVDTVVFRPPIDSSNMHPEHWTQLVKMIEDNYQRYDGFVVLHGTDTMAYTASVLSFMIRNLTKPIVLTGSQLPIGKLRTDAKENLITALEIAADKDDAGQPIAPEVCIFFQNYLMRGNRTVKMNADNFSAFRSYNYPALAKSGIEIRYDRQHILRPDYDKPTEFNYELDTNIVIIKLFPGISQVVVETILQTEGIKAVILETYGSGNAPKQQWFIDAVRQAVARGIVVVNVTQCASGSVEMHRYETGNELLKAGVVSGMDMTTESTLAKLMYLIGNKSNTAEVENLMQLPVAGELTRAEDRANEKIYH